MLRLLLPPPTCGKTRARRMRSIVVPDGYSAALQRGRARFEKTTGSSKLRVYAVSFPPPSSSPLRSGLAGLFTLRSYLLSYGSLSFFRPSFFSFLHFVFVHRHR